MTNTTQQPMRHIISILMENESGALSRVVNLFSARGYNIESLSVAPTEDQSISRLTLVTFANAAVIEQIVKQLNKLIDVIKLVDLTDGSHIEREIMLIKVKAESENARAELYRLNDMFRGRLLDVTESSYTIEMTGTADKLNAFVTAVETLGIIEIVRSGALGLVRGAKGLTIN
ncbi:Acetolactate synthase isozyme 3 small subunit [Wohlfahrtiimonas chitiniclastica SH04]|uniref:Acetolactate synthase small subunit n=2 Tax=Wohlfahrtiimonas chitiniclastica TaxID=400946 RepID=L8XYM5_9GAMM|nr:Acetolactate synthase isozyme 3 small subunit [Wohlfahrtiimonas chitiniclastica SH04]OYQ89345.1 acetolactate synthase small subunit [Wohlfahrtiimonas chitiniclastica]